jgi:hypothetical protein
VAVKKTAHPVEASIHPLCDKWLSLLGMDHWHIVVELAEAGDEECDAAAARCWPQQHYENATIRFYLPEVRKMNLIQLEEVVIHELAHCILDEGNIRWRPEEHIATLLSRAFMRVKGR